MKNLKELQKALVGKDFTLGELENEVVSIIGTENHTKGPGDYNRWEIESSFAFGCTEDQNGIYNVLYSIIQDNEEINDIVVKVKDVEVI